MTTINLLGGDFVLEFEDETTVNGNAVVGTRRIARGASPSETVYTTNALYSAIAEASDDFIAMGFRNPMLPVTPNEYSLENKYYITRDATEYLKEGTITADWSVTADTGAAGEGVVAVAYSGGTDFVAGDIGRQVTQGDTSDTGTLLDFETAPDGTKLAWIRPDDSTPSTGDAFDGTGTLIAQGAGAVGSATTTVAATNSATMSYNAIQVIGSVPTATEVYVVQNRIKLTSSTGGFQWWATDPDVSLGIISVLVRTYDPTAASWPQIAEGDIEVFSRRYTALYDNFRLNVAGGGFQALPLASGADINNTTGYRTFTGSGGAGTFTVGNAIFAGAGSPGTFADADTKGVITAVSGTTGAPVIEYYLIGDLSDFVLGDDIQEYDFSVPGNGDASCQAGTPSATSGGPTDAGAGEGGSVTITVGDNVSVDHDGDAVNENYSITVDANSLVPIAKVYERIKYVTRRGQDNTYWTAAANGVVPDVPGETYRGLEGIFEYGANTGSMPEGDNVSISGKPNFSARLMAQVASPATGPTHIALTDIQTSLQSVANGNVLSSDGSPTQNVTINGGGALGLNTFTSPKSSPFGTFTGSQIFGARGVVFTNPASADTQAYILTDNSGNLRTPPNTVSFTVSNTRAGDRILVARDTGTAGVIDKDQFGGIASAPGNGTTITVAGSIDSEVPSSGYVRVVETTLEQEHHYVYSSRTTGEGGAFTLKAITPGTADAGTGQGSPAGFIKLVDAAGDFVTEGVEVGMLVQDTTNAETYEVAVVDGANELTLVALFGASGAFASGDTYTINETIQTYSAGSPGTDNIYDLILDIEEDTGTDGTPGTAYNTFVQSTTFNVVVNVRQGKSILPFTQNVGITSTGGSVSVVRSPDTIAT